MFSGLLSIPADPLFGLQKEFFASQNSEKVNLGIGIYFDNNGNNYVMPSIQKASALITHSNNNYVSMRGDSDFLNRFSTMIFGHVDFASAQTVGGTHGVWTVGELISRVNPSPVVLVGTPTWANHFSLIKNAQWKKFPHLDGLLYNHSAYLQALSEASDNSILFLHGGKTHNPTGVNPNLEQLEEIIHLANKKKVFLLVDYAYFGMGEGWEEDQKYATIFSEKADRFAMVFSFSKNATLYKHRLGVVFVKDPTISKKRIEQNLENIVRESISNPPAFGAMVMNTVFDSFLDEWKLNLEDMKKILECRRLHLYELTNKQYPQLLESRGMFALMGFSSEKIKTLKEQGIFMPENGRINFGGLFPKDIEKVAQQFLD